MSAFDAFVQAKFHGGVMNGGPAFTVVHDAETPLRIGYADAIAEFFRKGPAAGTSAHAMVDPAKSIKMLPDNVVAYAAGPKANPRGWHLEQAGYARFTRADWTTNDGLAQARRVGACLREVHDQWGIPKRWMTDDQLRRAAAGDRASGGMTTHQQVARVLRGTTHTDPEDNYPRDLLLQIVLDDLEDDMPLTDADIKRIRDAVLFEETNLKSGVVGDNEKPTNLASQVLYAGWRLSQLGAPRDIALELTERTILIGRDGQPAMLRTVLEQAAAGAPVDVDENALAAALEPSLTAAVQAAGAGATPQQLAVELGKLLIAGAATGPAS